MKLFTFKKLQFKTDENYEKCYLSVTPTPCKNQSIKNIANITSLFNILFFINPYRIKQTNTFI